MRYIEYNIPLIMKYVYAELCFLCFIFIIFLIGFIVHEINQHKERIYQKQLLQKVKEDWNNYFDIYDPSESIQIEAVKQCPLVLRFIDYPNNKVIVYGIIGFMYWKIHKNYKRMQGFEEYDILDITEKLNEY